MSEAGAPSLFDTHVHLDADELRGEVELHWSQAMAAGVTEALAVGVSPATWAANASLARLPGVRVALGIHPEVVPHLDDETLDAALDALPAQLAAAGAAAVGECGLDGPSGDLERQLRVLRRQLEIARALALPITMHVFRVQGLALSTLRAFGALPAGGVVHSFSGSAEVALDWVRLGFHVGFAAGITRQNARRPALAARAVPIDRLVIETDAPYQPAGADRRDRDFGLPRDLPLIAAALAATRGIEPEALAVATTKNARGPFAQGKNKSG